MTDFTTSLSPEDMPSRTRVITEKIGTEVTGLRGSIFLHVGFIDGPHGPQITDIRASEKSKDGSGLDRILSAMGDALTNIVRREINQFPARTP